MFSVNDFCKKEYGAKLYKLSFSAGMTCPNRDGKIDSRGCIFCSSGGSGDFSVDITRTEDMASDSLYASFLEERISLAKEKVRNKYKGDRFIAYFQAFTNTYASVEYLRSVFMSVIVREDIAVLSIATRPDCINDEIFDLIKELNDIKPVWIELGLQTIKPSSVKYIRRGYDNEVYFNCASRLYSMGIHVITHVILYLPGESAEDMLDTVRYVVDTRDKVPNSSAGIKLQLLHILKGTDLAIDYEKTLENDQAFYIPSMEEYVETIKACLRVIPDDMVVHRLTGDPPKRLLIEPKWSADKKRVLNAVNEAIKPSGPYYVYILECQDGSFYTGSTNDVEKRFNNHVSGKGAKYTHAHPPVRVAYVEEFKTKSEALKRECAIKKLSRTQKIELINGK